MSRRALLLRSGIMQHLFVVFLFSDCTQFIPRMFAANCELCKKYLNIYRERLLPVEQLKISGDPFLWNHYVYMHSLFFFKNNSPRHCKRPSGSILGLLMFCNLIIFAVLPKSMYNASFHYEQVKRIRNSEFDIDFKVANFRFSNVMPNFYFEKSTEITCK